MHHRIVREVAHRQLGLVFKSSTAVFSTAGCRAKKSSPCPSDRRKSPASCTTTSDRRSGNAIKDPPCRVPREFVARSAREAFGQLLDAAVQRNIARGIGIVHAEPIQAAHRIGSQARDCETKVKAACCVAIGRSQAYSTPSTFQFSGRHRRGTPKGPASMPCVISNSVPS